MEQTAFISLGANIGNRYDYLESALEHLIERYPDFSGKFFIHL